MILRQNVGKYEKKTNALNNIKMKIEKNVLNCENKNISFKLMIALRNINSKVQK